MSDCQTVEKSGGSNSGANNNKNSNGDGNGDTTQTKATAKTKNITSTAFPLLTTQIPFYSFNNILHSLSDPSFENVLVTNMVSTMMKSRVDALSFHLPDLDEQLHCTLVYSHDLLLRIDELFSFMTKQIKPMVNLRKVLQQAVNSATQLTYRFARDHFNLPDEWVVKWNDACSRHFAERLYAKQSAPREFPLDCIDVYLEWLSHLWAVMECQASQLEIKYALRPDRANPYNAYYEPPEDAFRPLLYVQRVAECVFKPTTATRHASTSSSTLSSSKQLDFMKNIYSNNAVSSTSSSDASSTAAALASLTMDGGCAANLAPSHAGDVSGGFLLHQNRFATSSSVANP